MATTSFEYSTADISAGDLDEFDPSIEGNQYMFTNKSEPVYSATSHLKKQWIEDGYPNLVLPFSHSYTNSRASTRNCTNSWNQGDIDTIPTSSGNIIATVQKISSNAAIFIENGQILSATSLNDLASTFESTIYPTDKKQLKWIEKALNLFISNDILCKYEVDGVEFGHFPHWFDK
ncbi:MAG: hypothetical protein OR994_05110, partial [Candidatus Poseidoniales archaeon]|nr:hypothetical protein [Candidatus Poseidoniales archaeon]